MFQLIKDKGIHLYVPHTIRDSTAYRIEDSILSRKVLFPQASSLICEPQPLLISFSRVVR